MTIPRECKRLIEVDFPIAEVSKHSAREKSIRHGHPSTLHLWWARRPLAACRSVLLGLLLPDPCDPNCPEDFGSVARAALGPVPCGIGPDDEGLRKGLLKFIADFANWDMSSNPVYVKAGRELVKAAHGEEPPLVVDPFAGGGSIPLEALRLGCDAFASDLNPVACLILKVLLEDIPRHGPELAEELRRVGKEIKEKAEKELAEFYPPDPDGSRPIAYLWARTVRCESPNCGCEIPLARSFWLSKKTNRRRALKYSVDRTGRVPKVEFDIFTPKSEEEVQNGTVSRANATCPACRIVLPAPRVREQLAAQRGGADVIFDENGNRVGGARLTTVVTIREGQQGRNYRLAEARDYEAVWKATARLEEINSLPLPNGLSPVPDEPLPPIGTLGFRVQRYGMLQWGDLFTARQKVGLTTLATSTSAETRRGMLVALLALAASRCAEQSTSLVRWRTTVEAVAGTFGRQALPIMWDFVEIVITADGGSSYIAATEWVAEVVAALTCAIRRAGQVELSDACESPIPTSSAGAIFTDPPYYDAIPYSDLSDFFLAWLKRMLPGYPVLRDPFDPDNPLSPKWQEIVQDETRIVNGRAKDKSFFEERMGVAFAESRRVLAEDGVGCVVFAHKTTEGWEALLAGMVQGGWVITGSWPIATERPGRLRSQDSAALATSVHLVCRPRPADAPVGDWAEILQQLPGRIADWMERLSKEGVRGADLVFACIGPALELYSKYPRVETPEGRTVDLAEFLEKVWEVVGRSALEQILGTAEAQARNGGAGALEPDARLTALFLWTLQATGNGNGEGIITAEGAEDAEGEDGEAAKPKKRGLSLMYDVVRRFAQPLGIHLEDWEDRIIETDKGVVRLLPVVERAKGLFGEEGAQGMADHIETAAARGAQEAFDFGDLSSAAPVVRGRGRSKKAGGATQTRREATTLDRVHAAMLLQRSGRANALRALIESELDRGPEFLRLANALSALYPKDSEEKRLVDAMLLAVRR
ncbi:MAG: DUF1156 domain-containing protein [Armatimonadota bacterium]|nr:DUF1156 domain-containing protein [Armatimonadota bacterium]